MAYHSFKAQASHAYEELPQRLSPPTRASCPHATLDNDPWWRASYPQAFNAPHRLYADSATPSEVLKLNSLICETDMSHGSCFWQPP